MKTILILVMVMLTGCAAPKPAKWHDALTDDERQVCKAQGGCMVASMLWIYRQAQAYAAQTCGKESL